MNKGATVARGDPASVQRGDLLSEVFAVDTTVGSILALKCLWSCHPRGSEGWRQRMQAG